MGLLGVNQLCAKLMEHGLPGDTPMALVQKATTRKQKVLVGTLESMPSLLEQETVKPPTLIIVGSVVSLHEKLSWFSQARTVGDD
jgi:uroporphyrin-III C-methyltransferase/precorrin-2 dehydrogenase/sirohydrochlorin ferrochelatase